MARKITRKTKETSISVEVNPRGTGGGTIATDVPFLTHMLTTFARFSGCDVTVSATGDMEHHLVEDVAITLGTALREVIDGEGTIRRIASATVPMDDALVLVSLDLVDRPYAAIDLPDILYTHFFRSLAAEAKITLHVATLDGIDSHHVVEAAFKALGIAFCDALAPSQTYMSTKGTAKVTRAARK